jgi:hypothetical protein
MFAEGANMEIPIATAVSIREVGFDEYWLRDQIYDNTTCLGLGDIEPVSKEHIQSTGGRLDILPKNPEDDSMYEVEIMLGETDETHIIRTIDTGTTKRGVGLSGSITQPSWRRASHEGFSMSFSY